MKPNTAQPSLLETTRKHRNLQILSGLESGSRRPWGLSDQKNSPSHNTNVDLLSSLAHNIQRFQIKRRVRKGEGSLRRNFEEEEAEGVSRRRERDSNHEKEENFRDLIKSYKRRIQMLVTNEKTHHRCTEQHQSSSQIKIQFENERPGVLSARQTHRLNSVEVKFLPNKGNKQKKSPSLGEPLGQKILNQIRMKILSRKNSIRKDSEMKSQRSLKQDSCQQSKENVVQKYIQMHNPLMNISKIIPYDVREKQSKQLKIFDIQLFRKMNQSKLIRAEISQNFDENSTRLRRTRKPGWMSDRESCEFLMPR